MRCLLVWIAPESMEEVERRVEARESNAETRLRLATAAKELEAARNFDRTVVNETGRLEQTARKVLELVREEKARRSARTSRS